MVRIFALIAATVSVALSLTSFALFLRFIIGMFSEGTGVFSSFVFAITEPVLLPIRRRLNKIEALQDLPVDLSIFVAMIVLGLLAFILPSVRLS